MTVSPRGFTLWELVVVLSLMAIATGLAIPAFTSLGMNKASEPTDALQQLFRAAHRLAVARGATVTVLLDPKSQHFHVDTTGTGGGVGTLADTTLTLPPGTTLTADSARARFVFFPSCAAIGDSLIVRGTMGQVVVKVDPWAGVSDADSR